MLSSSAYILSPFFSKTHSIEKILVEIAAEKPHTLIILETSGGVYPDGLTFIAPHTRKYHSSGTEIDFDRELAGLIQSSLQEYKMRHYVVDEADLPPEISSLMHRLSQITQEPPRLILMNSSLFGAEEHYKVGTLIARALRADAENISLLGVGALSARHDSKREHREIPAEKYDRNALQLLQGNELIRYLSIDPLDIEASQDSLHKTLSTILGVLEISEGRGEWQTYDYRVDGGIGRLAGKIRRI